MTPRSPTSPGRCPSFEDQLNEYADALWPTNWREEFELQEVKDPDADPATSSPTRLGAGALRALAIAAAVLLGFIAISQVTGNDNQSLTSTSDRVILTGDPTPVRALAVLSDGRLAAAYNFRVFVWDPTQPEAEPIVFSEHTSTVRAIATLPDGRIASTTGDKTVLVWDPDTFESEPIVFSRDVEVLDATADGRLAAANGRNVEFIDPATPDRPTTFEQPEFGDPATVIEVLSDGRPVMKLLTTDVGDVSADFVELGDASVTDVAMLPNGNLAYAYDEGVFVWNQNGSQQQYGRPTFARHTDVDRIAALPDGRIVSSGDAVNLVDEVLVWNPDALDAEPTAYGEHTTNTRRSLAVLPDGRIAIAGGADGTIHIWSP